MMKLPEAYSSRRIFFALGNLLKDTIACSELSLSVIPSRKFKACALGTCKTLLDK